MELLRKGKLVIGPESIGNRRKFITPGGNGKTGGMKEELGVGDDMEVLNISFPRSLERRTFTYNLRRNDHLDIQHDHSREESLRYYIAGHTLSVVK